MKKICTTILAFTSTIIATSSSAENSYIALSLGQSSFPSAGDVVGIELSEDTSSTSYTLTYGYKLNNYFAIQASHYDFGKYSMRSQFTTPPYDQAPAGTGSIKMSGYSVALAPQYPLNEHFRLISEIGLHHYSFNTRQEYPLLVNGVYDSMEIEYSRKRNEELFYSLGFAYDFNENLYIELSYGKYNLDAVHVDNAALGFGYNF